MTPPPSKATPQTNGDSINIQGIRIGGALIRKVIIALSTLAATGGGYSFMKMHNSEMDTLKADIRTVQEQVQKIQGGQETIIKLLKRSR